MKEAELRKHADCSLCGNKIGATGLPLFWTVEIKRYGLDVNALRRQTGLGMMLSPALAMTMGPNEDMAIQIGDTDTITVCENCATKATCLAAMAEQGSGT